MSSHLMDYRVPCKASIVDNDMNLAISKICCFLNQLLNICLIEHISRNCNCAKTLLIDGLSNLFSLLCKYGMVSIGT